MNCACNPQTDLCDSCTELLGTGAEQERNRLYALLEKLGTIRPSIVGREWRVIYTETGPKDIHLDKWLGEWS